MSESFVKLSISGLVAVALCVPFVALAALGPIPEVAVPVQPAIPDVFSLIRNPSTPEAPTWPSFPHSPSPVSSPSADLAAENEVMISQAINATDFQRNTGGIYESVAGENISAAAVSSAVAVLTIFADPTSNGTGSSGGDGSSAFGTHAFITVRNVSNSGIIVGKFSGIAPGKTMSLGTWGNKEEHKGLWYDLEEYFVYYYGAYPARVSVSYILTQSELNKLNSFIVYNDYWSLSSNCSTFAWRAWNNTVTASYRLSSLSPYTPTRLANAIKAKFPYGYSIRAQVPYHYVVYYANGTEAPKRSIQFR